MATAWLAAAVATHLVVGVAAGHVAVAAVGRRGGDPIQPWRGVAVAGLVGGGLPDLDLALSLGWPLVHRGLLHTPLFGAVLVGAVAATRARRLALPLGAGVLSHLLLDSLTPMGIAWLFPWPTRYGLSVPAHSYPADAALMATSIAVVAAVHRLDAG